MSADDHKAGDFEGRLSRTEANLETLTVDLTRLTSAVDDGFGRLHDRLSAMSETKWGVVGQFLALFVTIAVLAFTPVWMSISDNKVALKAAHADRFENTEERGRLNQLVLENRHDLTNLNNKLNRQLEQLEATLQREVQLRHEQQQVEIDRVRKEVDWHWDLVHSRYGYRSKNKDSTNYQRDYAK